MDGLKLSLGDVAETKSRRLVMLVRPSLFVKLKAFADANGASVNAVANAILEAYLDGEASSDGK